MPGWPTTGAPPILGVLGRHAAFGFDGLTAPGIPGWVEGPTLGLDIDGPMPVVPDGAGVAGAMPGVAVVPEPVDDPPIWAWADTARIATKPAANAILKTVVMISLA